MTAFQHGGRQITVINDLGLRGVKHLIQGELIVKLKTISIWILVPAVTLVC